MAAPRIWCHVRNAYGAAISKGMKPQVSIAFLLAFALSFGAVGLVASRWQGVMPTATQASAPEISGAERLRPVGLTGAINRQHREGALLVDLRGGQGRPIATAIQGRVEQLPDLIKRHFARMKVSGRKFVIVIGDAKTVARADQILAHREGFDVLRYLPADFVERRTSRFLDTTVPQISPRDLQQQRARFTLVDIQLPHEQAVSRLPGSVYFSPYQTLMRGDFSGLPRGRAIALY